MRKAKEYATILVTVCLIASGARATEQIQHDNPTCRLRSLPEASECIALNKQAVDYAKVVDDDTRVLIFGETHATVAHKQELVAHKQELVAHMNELVRLGFTVLELEAMPSSKQFLITDYEAGTITRDRLSREIHSSWRLSPKLVKPYVKAIDAALKSHMNVVFLDSDDDENAGATLPNWLEISQAVEQRRESHWVAVIESTFTNNPNARIVALVGSMHIQSVQRQLDAKNIGNKAIVLEGGEFFYDTFLTQAARLHNLKRKRFMVKTVPDSPDNPEAGDYHLHLPQARNAIIIGLKRRSDTK